MDFVLGPRTTRTGVLLRHDALVYHWDWWRISWNGTWTHHKSLIMYVFKSLITYLLAGALWTQNVSCQKAFPFRKKVQTENEFRWPPVPVYTLIMSNIVENSIKKSLLTWNPHHLCRLHIHQRGKWREHHTSLPQCRQRLGYVRQLQNTLSCLWRIKGIV